jgi:hypothetical protein
MSADLVEMLLPKGDDIAGRCALTCASSLGRTQRRRWIGTTGDHGELDVYSNLNTPQGPRSWLRTITAISRQLRRLI